ncbi:MAG: GNAT family N-acetyltransferase [bacterium]|nr:GNAT family N-acetyltransferase [bacterium]
MIKIRHVKGSDHKAVMELVKNIWGGDDYIPFIFFDWVKDGGFFLAELNGEIAGLAKVTKFDKGEWWLEGLRVGKKFRGKKIANYLTEYVLEKIKKEGFNTIRYSTGADNEGSLYIGRKHGFAQIANFTYYSYYPRPHAERSKIKLMKISNPKHVFEIINKSELLKKSAGSLCIGWTFRKPSKRFINTLSSSGLILTTGNFDKDGFVIYKVKDGWKSLEILWLSGPISEQNKYINFINSEALKKGNYSLTITVPVYQRISHLFRNLGFKLDWKFGIRLLGYHEE